MLINISTETATLLRLLTQDEIAKTSKRLAKLPQYQEKWTRLRIYLEHLHDTDAMLEEIAYQQLSSVKAWLADRKEN